MKRDKLQESERGDRRVRPKWHTSLGNCRRVDQAALRLLQSQARFNLRSGAGRRLADAIIPCVLRRCVHRGARKSSSSANACPAGAEASMEELLQRIDALQRRATDGDKLIGALQHRVDELEAREKHPKSQAT